MEVGFLVDRLTALMMAVVTFVSLMVHVYTIGYMHDDPGYQRFFSYISLFTFSMLMLVMSNNFLQLFFGWEAVGLVSYLLIGFWFKRESAIFANLKAFLVNRVGDFGFILGIAGIAYFTNSLDYSEVFGQADAIAAQSIAVWPGTTWNAMTLICILLFIGAMGKSAQAPLHVWLPDSMEGPTPISALIHAATMVTAGIFMVARMSPLYELSVPALGTVMVIGAITAFFMGLLGIVQNDIKRVVAYSTLSQLGYMTVALGASAYGAAIFHLMTHAFFKALLFLAAGSVIIAMHHEQDIRRMGGVRKYMPITYWTSLVGTLALIGFPGTAGFFSKDLLIEAVHESHWAETDALVYWIGYLSVLLGVFVTALYSFRMFFLVFHGAERMDAETKSHLHESPWVVTVPLVMLAIPAAVIGWYTAGPVLFGEFFGASIVVDHERDVLAHMGEHWHGAFGLLQHALSDPGVLARGGRRPGRLVPVPAASGPAGSHPAALRLAVRPLGPEVLLRRPVDSRLRRRRPPDRQLPVGEGRPDRHRRHAGQRHRRHGRTARRCNAAAADRLPVHLRFRDDHRPDSLPGLADLGEIGHGR